MEKQRDSGRTAARGRLLIFCLLGMLRAASAYSQASDATVRPSAGQDFFPDTDIKFELILGGIRPARVQLTAPDFGDSVLLKTFRKTEENSGTKLEFWLSFSAPGVYNLAPLELTVQGRRRKIPFEPITIRPDPKTIPPRLVLRLNGETVCASDSEQGRLAGVSVPAGKKVKASVFLQHAVQLLDFSWELPLNSIFSKTADYEFSEVRYRENAYSEQLIPVADFSWTILAEGQAEIPRMTARVIAYNGTRTELSLSLTLITAERTDAPEPDSEIPFFDDAFSETPPESERQFRQITDEDCERLAQLRSMERNSLFSAGAVRQERAEFERSLGISGSATEFRRLSVPFFLAAFVLCLFLLVASVLRKKAFRAVLLAFPAALFLILLIYARVRSSARFAISRGCEVSSVPEPNAESRAEISAGSRVRVLETAGNWFYVELGDTGGWCTSDAIIFIQ